MYLLCSIKFLPLHPDLPLKFVGSKKFISWSHTFIYFSSWGCCNTVQSYPFLFRLFSSYSYFLWYLGTIIGGWKIIFLGRQVVQGMCHTQNFIPVEKIFYSYCKYTFITYHPSTLLLNFRLISDNFNLSFVMVEVQDSSDATLYF